MTAIQPEEELTNEGEDLAEEEYIRVQKADNMDREIFCLHMTYRHSDSLGGMTELNPLAQSDYTEELWRLFHDKLHSHLLNKEHDHWHDQ